MGVYIPNMEKPKECKTCKFCIVEAKVEGKIYPLNAYCFVQHQNLKSFDDCPLIELDLERDIPTVWYNRRTGQYEPKDTKQEVYERLYKLKNERRAND